MKNTGRFRDFVQSFTQFIADVGHEEERVFADGKAFLSELIIHDDWLPEQFANPNPERYQQYLLHCDPMERFSGRRVKKHRCMTTPCGAWWE
jgi:predicted metal-dependent enzyme (double-stranded beta helix superfamily)